MLLSVSVSKTAEILVINLYLFSIALLCAESKTKHMAVNDNVFWSCSKSSSAGERSLSY